MRVYCNQCGQTYDGGRKAGAGDCELCGQSACVYPEGDASAGHVVPLPGRVVVPVAGMGGAGGECYRLYKRLCVVGMCAASIVVGAADILHSPGSHNEGKYFLIVVMVGAAVWCSIDAQQHNEPNSSWMKLLTLLWPIGVPYYLYVRRRFAVLLPAIGVLIVMLFLYVAAYTVMSELCERPG